MEGAIVVTQAGLQKCHSHFTSITWVVSGISLQKEDNIICAFSLVQRM